MNPADLIIIKKRLKLVSLMKFITPFFSVAKEFFAISSSNVLVSKFLPDNKLTKSANLPRLNSEEKATMEKLLDAENFKPNDKEKSFFDKMRDFFS